MPSANLAALVSKPAGWLNTVQALTVKFTHLNTKRRGKTLLSMVSLYSLPSGGTVAAV